MFLGVFIRVPAFWRLGILEKLFGGGWPSVGLSFFEGNYSGLASHFLVDLGDF